jgi:hypothetical protein
MIHTRPSTASLFARRSTNGSRNRRPKGARETITQAVTRKADHESRSRDVTLKIPRPLYERLAQVIEDTGFRSVTEFCVYVLRDLVATHEETGQERGLSGDELALVRQRLRSLGYLER